MPKFKEKTSNRGKWNENQMKEAIKCVSEGKLSIRLAAERYNVPKSSLHDRVRAVKNCKEVILQPKLGRFDCTFSDHHAM